MPVKERESFNEMTVEPAMESASVRTSAIRAAVIDAVTPDEPVVAVMPIQSTVEPR